jgi:hypothetical protein
MKLWVARDHEVLPALSAGFIGRTDMVGPSLARNAP